SGDHVVDGVNVPFTQVVGSDGGDADWGSVPADGFTSAERTGLGAGDVLSSRITARVVAKLRTVAAVPYTGSLYLGLMHPDTVVSYQELEGGVEWREPHVRVDTTDIYNGTIGAYR